jgi:hypothetical protein
LSSCTSGLVTVCLAWWIRDVEEETIAYDGDVMKTSARDLFGADTH